MSHRARFSGLGACRDVGRFRQSIGSRWIASVPGQGDNIVTYAFPGPPMDTSLTPRQAEILEAIRTHIAETGRPPSRPELARALGIASTNAVFKLLAALEKKGAIALDAGHARGIRVA